MAVEKVVIIGSGPAGWTAAIYAARANLEPLVYEGALTAENQQLGTTPLGQLNLTTEVENFPSWPTGDTRAYLKTALPPENQPYWVSADKPQPSHGINGPELMELMRQQARNFGTRVVTDDIVKLELDKTPFVLHTLEGKTVEAHTVIIATGARANYIGLESEDRFKNRGVSACAVCDGALPRFRKKPTVVVGGGDSAIEEASYLTKFSKVVYLVHRRGELRASKIMQQRAFNDPNIALVLNSEVEEVLGDDEKGVTGVRLKGKREVRLKDGTMKPLAEVMQERDLPGDGTVIEASGMFAAIGHTPNTAFLGGQLELTEKGYLKWTTANRTYTSIEGVFAAGDVADDYYRQAVSAAGSGCMAALDAERYLAAKGVH